MTATRRFGHADSGKPLVSPSARPGGLAWNTGPTLRRRHGPGDAVPAAKGAKLVVMLVPVIAMLTAACGSGSDGGSGPVTLQPPTSTTRLLLSAPAPDPASGEGVAVAALREIYTWYPATEVQGAPALARARKWLGPTLIRTLDAPPAGAATPKATLQWADWSKSGAHVEAFAFVSGEKAPPGADPDRQRYKIGIEQTVVYPDGRREPLSPSTVVATVVRVPGGWALDEFR